MAVINPAPSLDTSLYMSIGECVSVLQNTARAAGGLADDNSGKYSTSDFHYALQIIFSDFVQRTHATMQVDSADTEDGFDTLDLSGIVGFDPARAVRYWIDDQEPISVVDIDEIVKLRKDNADAGGPPTSMSFIVNDEAELYPIPADAYEIFVKWWPTATSWTIGDTATNSQLVNIPKRLLQTVIATGGVYMLQNGQLPESRIVDLRWTAYLQWCAASASANNQGVNFRQTTPLRCFR